MKRLLPLAAFALLPFVVPWPRTEPPAPLDPGRELAALVPERCRIFVDASALVPALEQGLEHPYLRALQASELVRTWLGALPLAPAAALARADEWLGSSVLRAAADVGRRGLCLGYDPVTEKGVLVALGADAATVERCLALALDAIERHLGWPGALEEPRARWSGADVWMLGEAFVARREALLVLGNDEELVQETLRLAAAPGGLGLLGAPAFAAQRAARAGENALWAWLDLSALEPFADEGLRELRAANRTPAAQGFLGAGLGALLSARTLSAALSLRDGHALVLRLRGGEAQRLEDLAPLARAGAAPAELRGESLAEALLYRDYGRFVARRAELFPAETLAQFAEAVTNGALFFEGQDLGEDVLPRLSPWIRLVVRELEFAPERRPEIPLPGAAAVAVLDDEREGERWTAAFQTLVAILNVDQAQKGGRGMRLQLGREGDVEISAARLPTPGPGDGVDLRYSLEPALAVVGRHLVLGTHETLVRALVRELAGASPVAAASARETLALDARGWRGALARNAEALVAQKMLAEGRGRAAAEEEVRGLGLVLEALEGAGVELSGADPSAPELVLELRLARASETGETPR